MKTYILLAFFLLSLGCGEADKDKVKDTGVIASNHAEDSSYSPASSGKALKAVSESGHAEINATPADTDHPAYKRLQNALREYRKIAQNGGWPRIPAGTFLKQGDTSAVVRDLRKRLHITGDINQTEAAETDNVYDRALVQGVKNFQERHGITVDGIVGPGTLEKLNIPVREKIEKIQFSLNAWKNLPVDLSGKYIMVNVPEYRLRAFEQNQKVLEMKVIVGAEYNGRATPLFHDRMEHLIFSPYWNIPTSIAANEIIPKARGNRSYLPDNHYVISNTYGPGGKNYDPYTTDLDRVVSGDLLLKEEPNPGNALGLVKFMFPNQYAVYLHGTPKDHLFEEMERDYSHGCIRVEEPVELAHYALQANGGWTRNKVLAEMNNGDWEKVMLEEKIPVYIIYYLAYVDEDGTINFNEDIYDKEA